MDKGIFDRFSGNGLIKSADLPAAKLDGSDRAKLNRRGNEIFNRGDTETARRIFQTTGYSDGLIRVGDRYLEAARPIDALKMYWLARDDRRTDPLIEKAVGAIRKLLSEEVMNERPGKAGEPAPGS